MKAVFANDADPSRGYEKSDLTSGFREVFAKQKFGWSLQGGISKSLLYVFSARKKAEGSVRF